MLSAVILTKNEEKNIKEAIESVSFADEVIVVDNMSSDATRDIAQRAGAIVYKRDIKRDFASQRTYGMDKARGEWVFFLDADERVTPELRAEIEHELKTESVHEAYCIRRRDYFWGKHMRYGEVKKVNTEGLIRLVKKGSGMWVGKVHERFVTHETVKAMTGYINHYPHQTIKEFLMNVNEYSTLRAEELFEEGKKTNSLEIMLYPIGKFIHTYFLQQGFKDKAAGFVYSFMMAFHSFLVRGKLFFLMDR